MIVALTALSFALTSPVQAVDQKAIDEAIDRGGAYLVQVYAPAARGPRERPRETERSGQRALSLYAMMAAGVDPDDPSARRLLLGLSTESFTQTYDIGCMILALSKCDPLAHVGWIADLAHELIRIQEEPGDWGYPGHTIIDLSNTQYAALGLWKASQYGIEVPDDAWQRLALRVLEYQSEVGGFDYMAPGQAGTGSMTTAGVGTLAICEIELGKRGLMRGEIAERLRAAQQRGVDWLDANFTVTTNPGLGGWLYYYLYGLERMGAWTGRTHVGEHDWYLEGAEHLLKLQQDSGGWGDVTQTAFAILFLERATSFGPTGPLSPGPGATTDTAKGDFTLRSGHRPGAGEHVADGSVHLWIDAYDRDVVGPLEWGGEAKQGPRVHHVKYFVGETCVGVVLGDASRPADSAPHGARVMFARTGALEVTAKAWVQPPADAEGVLPPLQVLTSAPRTVQVQRALPEWVGELAAEVTALPSGTKPKAKASSTLRKSKLLPPGKYDAENLIDKNPRNPWLAKAGDLTPEIQVSYRKGPEIGVLIFHHAQLPGAPDANLARPVTLSVKVNGRDTYEIEMHPEVGRPTRFALPERVRLKRIDVELVELSGGAENEKERITGLGELQVSW